MHADPLPPAAAGIERYRNRALALALTLLVAPAVSDDALWRSMFFFAHIGAVLLWQPVVPQRLKLSVLQMALLAGTGALLSVLLSPWILLAWIVLLIGLTAGQITMLAPRQERGFYLGALALLVIVLFLLVVPGLLPLHLRSGLPGPEVTNWIAGLLGAGLVPLGVLAWRADRTPAPVRSDRARAANAAYDLVYTAWVVGLLLLVTFFGIALMALTLLGYLESMAITLIGASALLLGFSWISLRLQGGEEARAGAVLPALLSRYLLSFGLPYEVWLDRLTALHREESDPAQFFDGAMRALGTLAIVTGAQWRGAGVHGSFGAAGGGDEVRVAIAERGSDSTREIEVLLRTREALSPVFLWHFRLLIGLAAECYWAKAREVKLVQRNYLRAVHETGARLTHDVKNLLQSLNGVIEAVNYVKGDEEIRQLIGRQLPAIAQRLAATIAKLQAPSTDSQRLMRASAWWESARKRHEAAGVRFDSYHLDDGLPVVEELFDGALDNLVSNALRKRAVHPEVQVKARLVCADGSVTLSVEDDGEPVDVALLSRLFQAPVASRDGLGIGLYQLASRASELGYRLAVEENREGCVRFVLSNRVAA